MTGDTAISVDAASSDDEGEDGETYDDVTLERPTPGRELVQSLTNTANSAAFSWCSWLFE